MEVFEEFLAKIDNPAHEERTVPFFISCLLSSL